MTITFKYKEVKRPDNTAVKTPSIPILMRGHETFETLGLIDSGADVSAMPKDFAEILGLDLSGKKEPSFGIGGEIDSIETNVNITVEKGHEVYNFNIPVKVILGKYDFPVLLGRNGFFDKFVVSFDESKEKISLKKVVFN